MKYLILHSVVLGALILSPAFAQMDEGTSPFKRQIQYFEAQRERWETRAQETSIAEDKEIYKTLASTYERLKTLRVVMEAAQGQRKASMWEDFADLRREAELLRKQAVERFHRDQTSSNNSEPDPDPDPTPDPTPRPPASYKTESGFEIKLRLVD
jgi:hypothetical protein